MKLNEHVKQQIINAIIQDGKQYDSAAKQARVLGINSSQLSRLKRRDIDRVISETKWISIARKLDVTIDVAAKWKTAQTPVYSYLQYQLNNCQSNGVSGLLCDQADIGKSYSAKIYCRTNKNAVYIDCSQVKSKQRLIREIAKQFGLDDIGRYKDVYRSLIFYLRTTTKPLVVLDEAGDLDYPAFLELKALWNATEFMCGWYMMGADGLKHKIERNLANKKVGYTEIFSRFGNKYQKITPDGREEMNDFLMLHTTLISKANKGPSNISKLYASTKGSMRRVFIELRKTKKSA